MRYLMGLLVLCGMTAIAQLALVPAYVPEALRPDLGIMVAIAVLAYTPRSFGLVSVFCLGVQADLFGSARFGLLTMCYLLTAGLMLWAAARELTRGDLLAAWVGGLAGTALAHTLYLVLGAMLGLDVSWGRALLFVLALLLGAVVWGLPLAWMCGRMLRTLGLLDQPVAERWAAGERMACSRLGPVM